MATQGTTWLIGAGPMAQAYGHVLKALNRDTVVIGRGASSAAAFTTATGLPVRQDGLSAFLAEAPKAQGVSAIVAVPVAALAPVVRELLAYGVRSILVEKPAAITPAEALSLAEAAKAANASVKVAYNRRFLNSTRTALDMIKADGGVTSLRFEFAEFAARVGATSHPAEVKANWLYANSTHVIDLAFFLGGFPRSLIGRAGGSLDWHPVGARFVGHGETETGALFTYTADWESAPRWAVDIYTRKRVITLQPLEGLKTRPSDGFAETVVDVSCEADKAFKPGLYRMTDAFLNATEDARDLPSIEDHAKHMNGPYLAITEGRSFG